MGVPKLVILQNLRKNASPLLPYKESRFQTLTKMKLLCDSRKTGIVHVVRQTEFPENWDTLVKGLNSSLLYSKLKYWLVKPVYRRGPVYLSVVHPSYVSRPICAPGTRICASGKKLPLMDVDL